MVYVLEVFLKTKTEKRIGHSEGGFTLYEKLNPAYCFDSLDEDLKEWGYGLLLTEHPALADFLKTINGCAPRFVFKELVALVVGLA
jgi:anti-sigma regulatory factor (Ser/Thr protein kinase)